MLGESMSSRQRTMIKKSGLYIVETAHNPRSWIDARYFMPE